MASRAATLLRTPTASRASKGIKGFEKKAKEKIARYREPLSRGDSILAAIEAKHHDSAFIKEGTVVHVTHKTLIKECRKVNITYVLS